MAPPCAQRVSVAPPAALRATQCRIRRAAFLPSRGRLPILPAIQAGRATKSLSPAFTAQRAFRRSRWNTVTDKNPLNQHGIVHSGTVHWNLGPAALYEAAICRGEAHIGASGPLVCTTGHHTGRSARDKFVVQDDATRDSIWWGPVNQPMSPENFATLRRRHGWLATLTRGTVSFGWPMPSRGRNDCDGDEGADGR